MASDIRTMVKALKTEGYDVTFDGRNHYKVTHPSSDEVLSLAYTPSDSRWRQNFLANLRRRNLPIPRPYRRGKKGKQ